MEPAAIFIGFILLIIVIRLMAGSIDGERVERYLRERGWELVDRSWEPFGPGWSGEKDSRIYRITYRDEHGRLHRAHVKTAMFSGVYLTDDCIAEEQPPPAPTSAAALAEENRRLKARIRELENDRT
ncbi:MAG: hypothetical protein EOM72_00940 [Opitutae bacterium]|nr:hypothetical protein [Opitutae bacterium]